MEEKICKIGILGGGIGGISAGYFLKHLGHDVTVFEKENRIGGKCYSPDHLDGVLEMGAGAVSPAYRTIIKLCRGLGLRFVKRKAGTSVTLNGEILSFRKRFWTFGKYLRNLREVRCYKKYAKHCAKYDFHTMPDEYFVPFKEWCDSKNIVHLYEMLKSVVTGYGYGYLEVTPTFYVLHYINATNVAGISVAYFLLGINPLKLIVPGFGGLVDRLAESLDVRRNQSVQKITRTPESVMLTFEDQEYTFDYLFIATPITDVAPTMELSAEEQYICNHLEFYWYTVFAAEHEGLPRKTLYLIDRCVEEHDMHPTLVILDMQSKSVGTFYTPHYLVKTPPPQEKVFDQLTLDLKEMNAKITKVHETRQWRYFPHFKIRQPLAVIDDIQGKNRTFYVGGMCIFELTESITTHSESIVNRFFGGPLKQEKMLKLKNLWYFLTHNKK